MESDTTFTKTDRREVRRLVAAGSYAEIASRWGDDILQQAREWDERQSKDKQPAAPHPTWCEPAPSSSTSVAATPLARATVRGEPSCVTSSAPIRPPPPAGARPSAPQDARSLQDRRRRRARLGCGLCRRETGAAGCHPRCCPCCRQACTEAFFACRPSPRPRFRGCTGRSLSICRCAPPRWCPR